MADLYGTNVWEGNGSINWSRVAASSNGDFTMIRAGYDSKVSNSGVTDAEFLNYTAGAAAAGIPFGLWWFCYARNAAMATGAANYAADLILNNNINPTYPVYYDFEGATIDSWNYYGVTPTTALVHEVLTAWCNTIESRGLTPGIYFNWGTYSSWDFQTLFANHPTWSHWIAQWGNRPTWETWEVWQYMGGNYGHVRVDGIPTEVDVDIIDDGYVPPTPPGPYPRPNISSMPIWFIKPRKKIL